jgi:hypothetical protein
MRVLAFVLAACCISSVAFSEDQTNPGKNKPTDAKSESDPVAARRLDHIKLSARKYEIFVGPDFKKKLTVEPEPLLRFTNPVSGLQDGGFIVWKSEAGRPMAAAQFFLMADGTWLHEFQSLAPVPLKATLEGGSVWTPTKPGVEVKRVPDAPQPARTPVQRLVQMRDIAKRFSASDAFEGKPDSDELRLLSKPLIRYGADNSDTLDGALFVHAHGTDPELMIVIEALRSGDGYEWSYSLAPMTGYALKASLDGTKVWEVAWRQGPFSPTDIFFLRVDGKEQSQR